MVETRRAAVIGTTSWGTTLAILLGRSGVATRLWARTGQESVQLHEDGENHARLAGARFPESLSVTADPSEATEGAEIIVIAVPSMAVLCGKAHS